MRWMALHFPDLSLEVCPNPADAASPLAVLDQGHVHACNATATRLGVQHGHPASAAMALCPSLTLVPREPHAEQQAMAALILWAEAFSSDLVLEAGPVLLLEIGSAVRYFGGLPKLQQQALLSLPALGHRFVWSIAPTPLAALWFVRDADGQSQVIDQDSLSGRLERLPIEVLHLPPARQAALLGVGLRTLGQCLQVPASALAHRHGPRLRQKLMQALGKEADPRQGLAPHISYQREMELEFPQSESAGLLPMLQAMLKHGLAWARARMLMIRRLQLDFEHERHAPSRLVIGLAVTPDLSHLMRLSELHLARLSLPAAVFRMRLTLLDLLPLESCAGELFPDPALSGKAAVVLLELLQARLGMDAVTRLACQQDHRPERAWSMLPVTGEIRFRRRRSLPDGRPDRPLWLLEKPRRLQGSASPHWGGPLQLIEGPERIESGWWDGQDARRDYYIAASPQGQRYWIYRTAEVQAGWYLHGIFA